LFAVPFSGDSLYHRMIALIFPDIRKRVPYFGERWLDSEDWTGGFEPIN